MNDKERKFLEDFKKLWLSSDLKWREISKILIKVLQNNEPQQDRWKTGDHPVLCCDKEIPEELERKYIDFHSHIVQEVLNFINENPEIRRISEGIKKEIIKNWPEDYKDFMNPGINIYLTMSDIDESLDHKKWVPSLDSGFIIDVGGQTLIESL